MNNKFIYFGTDRISETVLNRLKEKGLVPSLIVTDEDKTMGRNLVLTSPPVKVWAEKNNIQYIQPPTLKTAEVDDQIKNYSKDGFDFAIVVSYGKIIPKNILEIPKNGMLNIHPSLLPKLRGPSPIISAILSEDETGVSVMVLDEQMDHGPILAKEKINIEWPPNIEDLETALATKGADLLVKNLEKWLSGEIKPIEQDHSQATFCKKIKKEDGLLNLEDYSEKNLRKIKAFRIWPKAYCFLKDKNNNEIRIIVKDAHIEENKLVFDTVIPEGKKEMSFGDWQRGNL